MMVAMGRRKEEDTEEAAVGRRIATNIQRLLKANGWTQGQLAIKARLTQPAISQLAMGRRRPSIETVYRISEAFGVDLVELAGFKPLQIRETHSDDQDLREQVAALNARMERMSDSLADLLEKESPGRRGTRKRSA